MLKKRYQMLFITFAVLEIFYPSILAGLCFADDVQLFKGLYDMNDWSLKGLFSPSGIYYRPLLGLSFIMDKEIWFLNERIMHLENVILHLLNVLLVYSLARLLLPEQEKENSFLPLIAALCFALHPINTESVNWISGRTDVMAGTFVFLSAIYLVKFKKEYKKRFLAISALSLLFGVLSKEVALAFLPGVFCILTAKDDDKMMTGNSNTNNKLVRMFFLILVILAVPALLYLQFKLHTINSDTTRLGKTIIQISSDPYHALLICLRAFGFYMKKLYLPLPLNFTIFKVDPLYELLAIPILLLSIIVALKRTTITAIYTAGIFLITPSFLLAFNKIAWMPYAERYVYITSAFVIIPSVFYIYKKAGHHRDKPLIKVGVFAILIIMSMLTLQRNIFWMKTTAPYEKVKYIVE